MNSSQRDINERDILGNLYKRCNLYAEKTDLLKQQEINCFKVSKNISKSIEIFVLQNVSLSQQNVISMYVNLHTLKKYIYLHVY